MYIKFFKKKIKFSEYFRSNIEKIILERLKETDKFYLVVPGGSTIKVILKLLNSIAIDWSKIYLIFSDERCVPIYNDLRNDLIIDKHLREYNFLKKLNFIRIPAELGPKEGTNKFKKILDRIPDFDLCILGFGEDGHTASLFPNHSALKNKSSAVAITNSPKFPPNRISIGGESLDEDEDYNLFDEEGYGLYSEYTY